MSRKVPRECTVDDVGITGGHEIVANVVQIPHNEYKIDNNMKGNNDTVVVVNLGLLEVLGLSTAKVGRHPVYRDDNGDITRVQPEDKSRG